MTAKPRRTTTPTTKPSTRKHKKLQVVTPSGKTVHFGDTRYQDFTQHGDAKRRKSYCARATKIRDGKGRLTVNNPESANYYATRLLWGCRSTKKPSSTFSTP